MGLEDVVQKVAVEGMGEAGSQFTELGRSGEEAFRRISEAAEGAGSGLSGFGGALTGTVAAVGLVVAAVMKFGLAAAEMGHHLEEMGHVLGTNAGGVQALQAAWGQAGGKGEEFTRLLDRMAVRLALTQQQVARAAREGPVAEEAASERVVAANINIEEAKNRVAHSSEDWRNKLTGDAIAVEEAWQKLQFAAQDSSAKVQNSMLSVAGAALSAESARQHLSDLESGKTDKAANKDIQLRQARQSVAEAEQRERDARTAQQKTLLAAPLAGQKAQLGLDEATLKQTKDFENSLIEPAKNANDLAKAFTGLREATNHLIDAQLKNINNVTRALENHDQKFLTEAGPQLVKQAITLQSQQRADFDPKSPQTALIQQLHDSLTSGALPTSGPLMASLGQQFVGGRGAEGADFMEKIAKGAFDGLADKIKAGEKDTGIVAGAAQGSETIAKRNQLENQAAEAMVRFGTAISPVPDFIDAFSNALKRFSPISSAGKARGGPISGPGGPESDTAGLFALSDGEYVVRSKAVAKVGLGVMDAINNMTLDGFAMGGPVGALTARRMAAGGRVGAGSTLNLSIDGQRFEGLHAPENVAGKLKSYAVSRQTAQTGNKPSWVR